MAEGSQDDILIDLGKLRRRLYIRIIFVDVLIGSTGILLGATKTASPFESIVVSVLFAILAQAWLASMDMAESQFLLQSQAIAAVTRIKNIHDFTGRLEEADGLRDVIVYISDNMIANWRESNNHNFGYFYAQSLSLLKAKFDEIQAQYSSRTINLEGQFCLAATTECFHRSSGEIFAISFADNNFWQSDVSSEYFNANNVALQKGTRITRLFVFDAIQQLEDESFQQEVLKRQLRLGPSHNRLKLLLILRSKARPIEPIPDISLFNNKLMSMWDLRGGQTHLDKVTITWHPSKIREGQHSRDYLVSRSNKLNNISQIDGIIELWKKEG